LASLTNGIVSATSTTINYSGKTLWVVATSILLLGIPYALALGEEQQIMEEQRQAGMMAEGAQGMIQSAGQGQQQEQGAKPAL